MEDNTMELYVVKLQKELRFTRVICMISSLLTICILICVVMFYGYVQKLVKDVEPVMATVSELNVEEINNTLQNVNASLEAVDWQQVSDAVSELDVEAINDAIDDLDTEEISETLTNINDAVDKLKEIGDGFKSFFGIKE